MFPVWLMQGRVIIGISSPKGKNNHFAKLFDAKDPENGDEIFNTLVFQGACKKCKERGKTATCNHEPWVRWIECRLTFFSKEIPQVALCKYKVGQDQNCNG